MTLTEIKERVPAAEHIAIRVVDSDVHPVPRRGELVPQLGVIEQLAVERELCVAVLVAHRLPAACRIEDREARVGESAAKIAVDARGVGEANIIPPPAALAVVEPLPSLKP